MTKRNVAHPFTQASFTELGKPEGSVIFNLSAYTSGARSVIDSIPPDQKGIYAWFRNFSVLGNSSDFAEDLFAALAAPKFQSRTGTIAPYYEVTIESKTNFSESKKDALETALKRSEFITTMKWALNWSVLFQAPLYIGKSIDIRSRTDQHLKADSPLRRRLSAASINLDECLLLVIPIQFDEDKEPDSSTEQEIQPGSDQDELIFEEIFSRLFNPAFTLRIG